MRNLHLNSHSKIVVSEKIGKEFDLNPDSFQFHVASSPACITIYSSGKILSLRDDDNVDEVSIVEALREENISDDRLAGIEVTSEGNVVLATKTGVCDTFVSVTFCKWHLRQLNLFKRQYVDFYKCYL